MWVLWDFKDSVAVIGVLEFDLNGYGILLMIWWSCYLGRGGVSKKILCIVVVLSRLDLSFDFLG